MQSTTAFVKTSTFGGIVEKKGTVQNLEPQDILLADII